MRKFSEDDWSGRDEASLPDDARGSERDPHGVGCDWRLDQEGQFDKTEKERSHRARADTRSSCACQTMTSWRPQLRPTFKV